MEMIKEVKKNQEILIEKTKEMNETYKNEIDSLNLKLETVSI